MTDRHQPIIDALNERRMEIERSLGIEAEKVEEDVCERENGEDDGDQVEEEGSEKIRVGMKRKRKMSKKQVSKRSFLDDEAEQSGSDESDDEHDDDDDDDESDLESMIDDSSDVEENNTSFHRDVDRNRSDNDNSQPGPSTEPQQPTLLTP